MVDNADIRYHHVRVSLNTPYLSTTDIACPFTPKGVMLVSGNANTTSNPEVRSMCVLGFFDGTDQLCISGERDQGQSSPQTWCREDTTCVARYAFRAGVFLQYQASFEPGNVVRFTQIDNSPAPEGRFAEVLIFGGGDFGMEIVSLYGTTVPGPFSLASLTNWDICLCVNGAYGVNQNDNNFPFSAGWIVRSTSRNRSLQRITPHNNNQQAINMQGNSCLGEIWLAYYGAQAACDFGQSTNTSIYLSNVSGAPSWGTGTRGHAVVMDLGGQDCEANVLDCSRTNYATGWEPDVVIAFAGRNIATGQVITSNQADTVSISIASQSRSGHSLFFSGFTPNQANAQSESVDDRILRSEDITGAASNQILNEAQVTGFSAANGLEFTWPVRNLPSAINVFLAIRKTTFQPSGDVEPQDLTHSHGLDQPDILTSDTIQPEDLTHAHILGTPLVTSLYTVTPQTFAHAHVLGEPVIDQTHVIAPAALLHAHLLGEPVVSQTPVVSPQSLTHGHVLGEPGLTQTHTMSPANLTHAHLIAEAVIVQTHVLAADGLLHATQLSRPFVTQAQTVSVENLNHATVLSSPGISQTHLLTADALTHGHLLDEPSLVQTHILPVEDLLHSHAIDEVAYGQTHIIQGTTFTHGTVLEDAFVFETPTGTVQPQPIRHPHSIGSPDIVQTHVISPDGFNHVTTISSPVITETEVVAPQALTHSQLLGEPDLTSAHTVSPNDLPHMHKLAHTQIFSEHTMSPLGLAHAHLLAEALAFDPSITRGTVIELEGQETDIPSLEGQENLRIELDGGS